MLNPNEIAGKKFDRVMGRGYRPDDVDSFLAKVAEEINELLEDKKDLDKKMMVLADKLEEYKDDEESLRAALLGAQKLGDSVVREAKAKAKDIIETAQAQANLLVESADKEIERQQAGFVRMQREVATFKSKLQFVYKQHLELISAIPVDESIVEAARKKAMPPVEEKSSFPLPEEPIGDLYEELPLPEDDSLSYSEQTLEYANDEISYEPEPETLQPQRESRFGPLKFGKDFDIKREDDNKRRK